MKTKTQSNQGRKFLQGVVKTRKYLIKTGRSKKNEKVMNHIIMLSEDLLNRMPSEESVKQFLQRYYPHVRMMIPARGSDDKRYQTLERLVNA